MTESSPAIDLDSGLKRLGYSEFRAGQREAITTLLEQRRLLLVAPTGGGKSLTYQLPAVLLPGTTLVICPLVALMHDQVAALRARGVEATYLAATLDPAEARARLAGIMNAEYQVVYVAPERLAFGGFRNLIQRLKVPLVAVDEAHCISEWGHDFRPDYMQIGEFLKVLQPQHVLACTATATPVVRDEILARLGLAPETPQIVQGFARPNLALRVEELRTAREREPFVDQLIDQALGSPAKPKGTAIVYAPTRKSTQEEASRLKSAGWRAAAYHAGMPGSLRDKVQEKFINNELDVVVATNAFGMGIDRADVRAVVHLAPPSSIEAYYQEVGRAGRDGDPAYGLMLYTPSDIQLRRRLLEGGSNDVPTEPAVFEHKWGMFLELLRWAEGGSCRHDAILRYFGDEAETLAGCGRCDVCTSLSTDVEVDEEHVTLIVRKALSSVARVHRRYGLVAAAKLLRGAKDPRLQRSGLDQTKTFGVLSEHPEVWLVRLLRRCVTAGWVGFTSDEHPLIYLTADGQEVMAGTQKARFLLPPVGGPVPRDKSASAGRRAKPALADLDQAAQGVFEALRRHRLELAKADGVPPYVIASDRTLRDIAMLRPSNEHQLGMAHGIGPAKLERFGDGFLKVVAQASP